MTANDIANAAAPIYFALFCGVLASYTNVFTLSQLDPLNIFLMKLAIPAGVVSTLLNGNIYVIDLKVIGADLLFKIICLATVVTALYGVERIESWRKIVVEFIRRKLNRKETEKSEESLSHHRRHEALQSAWFTYSFEEFLSDFCVMTVPNTLIIGLPFLVSLYGQSISVYVILMVIIQSAIHTPMVLVLYEFYSAKRGAAKAAANASADRNTAPAVLPLPTATDGKDRQVEAVEMGATLHREMSMSAANSKTIRLNIHGEDNETDLRSSAALSIVAAQAVSRAFQRGMDVSEAYAAIPPSKIQQLSSGNEDEVKTNVTASSSAPSIETIPKSESLHPHNFDKAAAVSSLSSPSKSSPVSTSGSTSSIIRLVASRLYKNLVIHAALIGVILSLVFNSSSVSASPPSIITQCLNAFGNTQFGIAVFAIGVFFHRQFFGGKATAGGKENNTIDTKESSSIISSSSSTSASASSSSSSDSSASPSDSRTVWCGWSAAIRTCFLRFIFGPLVALACTNAVGMTGLPRKFLCMHYALPQAVASFSYSSAYNVLPNWFVFQVSIGTMIAVPWLIALYFILEAVYPDQ